MLEVHRIPPQSSAELFLDPEVKTDLRDEWGPRTVLVDGSRPTST